MSDNIWEGELLMLEDDSALKHAYLAFFYEVELPVKGQVACSGRLINNRCVLQRGVLATSRPKGFRSYFQ